MGTSEDENRNISTVLVSGVLGRVMHLLGPRIQAALGYCWYFKVSDSSSIECLHTAAYMHWTPNEHGYDHKLGMSIELLIYITMCHVN